MAIFRGTFNSADQITLAYHKDLAPAGTLDLPAMQLLASCQSAWVFGGMGSWNDLGFAEEETNKTYNHLSDQLFSVLMKAICVATNQSVKCK